MERVRQWVLTNHTVSESVLSTVQTLGTFVPGRWGEREVLFETGCGGGGGSGGFAVSPPPPPVNASLVVVALVEDLIVHEHLQRVDVASLDPPMRATWHSIPTPGLERMLCWALSLLRAVETPLEMACAKHAPRRRWAAVWIVEWVKALLKVLLLLKRRGRMLVKQGCVLFVGPIFAAVDCCRHPLRALVNQLPVNKATAGGENQEAGVRHERDFDDDLFPATAQSVAGEALHIARPLVHLALLSKVCGTRFKASPSLTHVLPRMARGRGGRGLWLCALICSRAPCRAPVTRFPSVPSALAVLWRCCGTCFVSPCGVRCSNDWAGCACSRACLCWDSAPNSRRACWIRSRDSTSLPVPRDDQDAMRVLP